MDANCVHVKFDTLRKPFDFIPSQPSRVFEVLGPSCMFKPTFSNRENLLLPQSSRNRTPSQTIVKMCRKRVVSVTFYLFVGWGTWSACLSQPFWCAPPVWDPTESELVPELIVYPINKNRTPSKIVVKTWRKGRVCDNLLSFVGWGTWSVCLSQPFRIK